MITSVPLTNNYILITNTIKASDKPNRWDPLTISVQPTNSVSDGVYPSYQSINLEPGEWYRVKNMIRPSKGLRNHYNTEYLLTLALDSKPKERKWARAKINEGFRATRHQFNIRIEDLIGNSETYTDLDSLRNRLGIIRAVHNRFTEGRFTKIGL